MIYGLYQSGNGMRMQMRRQEVISNNLANSSSTGYKSNFFDTQDMASANERNGRYSSFERNYTIDRMGGGPWIHSTRTNHAQGQLLYTENNHDFAIEGEGFFKVRDPADGTFYYTRNGNFITNSSNQLVMPENGFQVMNQNDSPINLTEVGNDLVGALKIVSFENLGKLQKEGSSLFKLNPNQDGSLPVELPTEANVLRGYLEESNTNSINEMVNMIEAHRAYQANATTLRQQDENIGTLMGITRL